MTIQILLLAVLMGITILGYMIAINSHGAIRLSISYLLATVLLATTVICVVQYVNTGKDSVKMEELRRLELEKQTAEEKAKSQEEALRENQNALTETVRLSNSISSGMTLSTQLLNIDLRDMSIELDGLVGRAADARNKINDLKEQFSKSKPKDPSLSAASSLVDEAITKLIESSQYYSMYYRSEDSAQEELRERIMRQKAREAYEKLKKAADALAATKN